ncbi:MAG: DUF4421 family protein [Bacteroidaceae bacterium]|nr:DUF4421 family protein [Bacteroidaceae bacterium]
MRKAAIIVMLLMVGGVAFAQSKREKVRERVDSVLRTRYEKVSYDTLYMERPDAKLTLKFRGNLSGNSIRAKQTTDEQVRAKLSTDLRATVSAAVTYYGITAGLAINPAQIFGGKNKKDWELNLNAYFNRFGLEVGYQYSKTLSGDISDIDGSYHIDKGLLRLSNIYVTGYYAFNHRRFSYPAAFTQSYIQKKSAGSWLVGFSYQGGSIKTTGKATDAGAPEARIYAGNFAIGGGYGYNLVAKKWLFHLSAQPNIIIFNGNNITIDGEKTKESLHFPEMIINSRAAILYNISPKCFVGSTVLVNTSLLGDNDDYTRQVKWRARAFVGIRL